MVCSNRAQFNFRRQRSNMIDAPCSAWMGKPGEQTAVRCSVLVLLFNIRSPARSCQGARHLYYTTDSYKRLDDTSLFQRLKHLLYTFFLLL